MNLVLDENNYNINNIFFYEPVKNTVMDDSKFIRIIYSDEHVILNGLYLKLDIEKKICMGNFLDKTEREILNKYKINKNNVNKNKCIKIQEQLQFFINKNILNKNIVIKISGIWETNLMIGLTYKFMS
ncbi:hypothetical protein ceV_390 [Chrysochromulina ericina virus CeV-01B]|uniref:Uncharacterized protein n=1 Tax=Chrysochromulina ericina virus CeV-01B TaxID=3070830 RepID=A0A0N9R0X2_9VIRU|nr:hypothetical protein ceV_390 [Chrysochromulina ericina virus]ALH23296.1 hypothetical protein ceV_390 [Chrysochromulina ericina virus CeV-01B]|tara:strand:- start:11160 stop:11543 length:384 start_codon:yes stop_codon:yes gene_type:complete